MDPDETLAQMREALEAVWAHNGSPDPTVVERLAQSAAALDRWMSQGGFPPTAWNQR